MTQRVECLIEDKRWEKSGIKGLAQRALEASFRHFNIENQPAELSILASDNMRIAKLNATYRQRDVPTNILSWPTMSHARPAGGMPNFSRPRPRALGDLALAYETCEDEAHRAEIAFSDHLGHLLVHGILHLLGFDHEDDLDWKVMMQNEAMILEAMGMANPYQSEMRENETGGVLQKS